MLLHSPYHFLFGWGIDGFRDNWNTFKQADFSRPRPSGPHSFFLELFVSGGVVAGAFMLAFGGYIYRAMWRMRHKIALAIPLLAGLTGILVDGLFHTHLYTKYLWIIVGILLALIFTYQRKNKEKRL